MAVLALDCREPRKHSGVTAINEHCVRDETPVRQKRGTVLHQQLHHAVFADALAAERKNVDGPADGPHHVIVEVARERIPIAIGQGTVKRLDDGAGGCFLFLPALTASEPRLY